MASQSRTYDDGAALTANAFWRTHYKFAGWNTAADGSGTSFANGATANMRSTSGTTTLYAQWTRTVCHVNFLPNGGTGTMAEQTFESGVMKAISPCAFSLVHHTFAGWVMTSGPDCIGYTYYDQQPITFCVGTDGDRYAMTARWNVNTYTVSFNSGGGSPVDALSATYPATIALPSTSRTGYTFDGWYTAESGGTKAGDADAAYQPLANVTLHARWTANQHYVDVYDGYSDTRISSTQRTFGAAFSLDAPKRDHYVFKGWQVTAGLNPSTAKWGTSSSPSTAIADANTVCYNGEGGAVYFTSLNASDTSMDARVSVTAIWERRSFSVTVSNALSQYANARVVCMGGSFTHWNGTANVTVDANVDAAISGASGTFTFYSGLSYSVVASYLAASFGSSLPVLRKWGGKAVTRTNVGAAAPTLSMTRTMSLRWTVTVGETSSTVYTKQMPNVGGYALAYSDDACTTAPSGFDRIERTSSDAYALKSGDTEYAGSVVPVSDATQTWETSHVTVSATATTPFADIVPTVAVSFDETDTDGTHVKAVATGADGIAFSSWSSDDPSFTRIGNVAKLQVASSDVSLVAAFAKAQMTVSASLDPLASAACGQSDPTVSVSAGPHYYRDTATVSITGIPQEFSFAGWYSDGSLVSESASYSFSVTSGVSLVARLMATVALAKYVEEETAGTVSASLVMNGTTYHGDSCSQTAVIGDYVTIGVTQNNASTSFICWFVTSDANRTPLEYQASQSVQVLGTLSLSAHLMDRSQEYYVAFYNRNVTTAVIVATLGQLVPSGTSLVSITKAEYETAVSPSQSLGDGVFYRFNSTQRMQLSIAKTGSLEYLRCRRFRLGASSEGDPYSTEQTVVSVVNQNLVYVAEWGTPTRYAITASLASSEDLAKGSVDLGGYVKAKSYGGTSTTGQCEAGLPAAVWAKARNGYDFAGWYADRNTAMSSVPKFNTAEAYAVGDFVRYGATSESSSVYRCVAAHSAGSWNAGHFTLVPDGDLSIPRPLADVAEFAAGTRYKAGDFVRREGLLYKCIENVYAIEWDASKFAGPESADAYYEFSMPGSAKTLYAKFVSASVSLYRWEGGNARMQLSWKSKAYALSKPANLNSIRVDATGYPLARVKVESFSSPDSSATSTVDLTGNAALADQSMRRLPARRPERFFQVTVESTSEVDAIVIGTSGEGLAT